MARKINVNVIQIGSGDTVTHRIRSLSNAISIKIGGREFFIGDSLNKKDVETLIKDEETYSVRVTANKG